MAASETINLLELFKYENRCKTFQQQYAGYICKQLLENFMKYSGQNDYDEVFLKVKLHGIQLKKIIHKLFP